MIVREKNVMQVDVLCVFYTYSVLLVVLRISVKYVNVARIEYMNAIAVIIRNIAAIQYDIVRILRDEDAVLPREANA